MKLYLVEHLAEIESPREWYSAPQLSLMNYETELNRRASELSFQAIYRIL